MKKGGGIIAVTPPLKMNEGGVPAKKGSAVRIAEHVAPSSSPSVSLSLQAPASPRMPVLNDPTISDVDKLQQIQTYIEEFEYNYSGKPFLKLNKAGGAKHLQTSALELIRMALPIQCVEALFIGCWLSKDMRTVDRLPLSFKSIFQGNVHRHIVMAIRCDGKWGAIGISRRSNLMDKPIVYDSLIMLIREYEMSYEACFHRLLTVYIGLPLPRVFTSDDRPIRWRAMKLRLWCTEAQEVTAKVEHYLQNAKKMERFYIKYGRLPDLATTT